MSGMASSVAWVYMHVSKWGGEGRRGAGSNSDWRWSIEKSVAIAGKWVPSNDGHPTWHRLLYALFSE